jgi:RHS repeat-associated protein
MELSESGEMVKWAIYHPFGREIVSVSATPVLPPLGSGGAGGTHGSRYSFAWKELDRESDVHYFEWRYYDDGSGRFTSVDPVHHEVGITQRGKEALLDPELSHPYIYARNGPMRYVDPSGQIVESGWDIANVAWDVWGIGWGAALWVNGWWNNNETYKQYGIEGMKSSATDVGADSLAFVAPGVPAGASKVGRALEKEVVKKVDKIEWYIPDRRLPRDTNWIPIPDSQWAHTQIWKKDWRNGLYKQGREWWEGGTLKKDIDFTDHWRPWTHSNPHSHEYTKNPTWWTPKRDKAK